jgi:glycerophosphoryl diester phosphodiesterase
MPPKPHHPLVISHRTNEGNSPENTLLGIARAIEEGCDVVELDVRATRDGMLVLMHDETLERTTADPRAILDVTYEELSRLRWGAPQGYEAQSIPTLAEAYAAVLAPDGKPRIAVEVDIPAPGLEREVAALIRRLRAEPYTLFTPSSEREVLLMQEHCPDVPVFFDITHDPLPPEEMARRIRLAAALGVRAINPTYRALTPGAIALAHDLGLEVACWTVDTMEDLAAMVELGVDAITTNFPQRLIALLEARESSPNRAR